MLLTKSKKNNTICFFNEMSPSWVETPYVHLFVHHLAFTGSFTHFFPFSHLRHQQYSLISLFFSQIFPYFRGFTVIGSVC